MRWDGIGLGGYRYSKSPFGANNIIFYSFVRFNRISNKHNFTLSIRPDFKTIVHKISEDNFFQLVPPLSCILCGAEIGIEMFSNL